MAVPWHSLSRSVRETLQKVTDMPPQIVCKAAKPVLSQASLGHRPSNTASQVVINEWEIIENMECPIADHLHRESAQFCKISMVSNIIPTLVQDASVPAESTNEETVGCTHPPAFIELLMARHLHLIRQCLQHARCAHGHPRISQACQWRSAGLWAAR